ncbi:hypothetical protein J5N97_010996 [Dioscorea zingiberensis]|uniref:Uncharacterized protein n=1 Tax=Dioscorea zingiberensis TaxID=325984 RepID=A0A9D5HNB0_9LILI|nr:hypothetical protein J5N97_010996 [Dioscorea zingiberensis]
MLEEKTHLDRYTVALVTKLRCIIDPKKVIEAVAAEHDPELKWEAETYDDRRFLLRCPSTSIARRLESRGEIDFPAFSASFEPWSNQSADVEGRGRDRWIHGKGLPRSGREETPWLRRGRTLPTSIDCSIFRRKYTVRVETVHGQPPLPWESETTGNPAGATRREEEERQRKGKATVGPLDKDRDIVELTERQKEFGSASAHVTHCDAVHSVRANRDETRRKDVGMPADKAGQVADSDWSQNGAMASNQLSDARQKGVEARQHDSGARHMSLRALDKPGIACTKNRSRPVSDTSETHMKRHARSSRNGGNPMEIFEQHSSHKHVAIMENSPLHDNQPNILQLGLGDSNTCNTHSTKQKANVNRFEEYNDTQADPIPSYPNSNNEEDEDLDDEMAERLEMEIEQEIEDMWQAQLEWEKSQERGEESMVPINPDQAMEGPNEDPGKGDEYTIAEKPSS